MACGGKPLLVFERINSKHCDDMKALQRKLIMCWLLFFIFISKRKTASIAKAKMKCSQNTLIFTLINSPSFVYRGTSFHTKADWHWMPSAVSTTHTWFETSMFITCWWPTKKQSTPWQKEEQDYTGPCIEWFGTCFVILYFQAMWFPSVSYKNVSNGWKIGLHLFVYLSHMVTPIPDHSQ